MDDRRSPPFGEIPGMIPGEYRVVLRTASTAVVLAGFQSLATGALADLRTTTVSPGLRGLILPIEQRRPDDPLTGLTVVARLSDDTHTAGTANVTSGSQGEDRGIDARHLWLWFRSTSMPPMGTSPSC